MRKLVETQLRRLSEGSVDTDSTGMPTVSALSVFSKISKSMLSNVYLS